MIIVLAHQEAWEKAGILHRDVSASNILFDLDTGEALLNDWDLAKLEADLQRQTQHGRSVSLSFAAAAP